MELSELNAFVKVVQTASFTKAAELLRTRKSHISRQVSQLENELGVRLLERSTRALRVTEVGRDFFERAVAILDAVQDAEQFAQSVQGEPRGVLRLTSGVEFGMLAVGRWIDGFLARHPQVSVEVDLTARVVDLVHEGFDLAIRVGPLDDSRLSARKLGEVRYGLYASPGYLKRFGTPQEPAELVQHPALVFNGGSHGNAWFLRRDDDVREIAVNARLRANNNYVLLDAACSGRGIAQLPVLIADPCVARKQLVPILSSWHITSVPVYAVFPSNRYLSPKVRAFIDHAVERFAAKP
jgi:DNA-binding transcriptional LysR family regulator